MTTPSATTANSQYDAVVEKLTALLKGSGIDVISAVSSGEPAKRDVRWPVKGRKSCLVLYETAEDAVARGLLSGQLPSQVLARWMNDAENLLARHRQARRQLTFVSITSVLTQPEDFLNALSRRFGDQDFPGGWLISEKLVWSAWQGLLARQIVSSEADATRLSSALEAAALPLEAYRYDPDAAASELDAMRTDREQLALQIKELQIRTSVELSEAKVRQSDLEAERALLRDQIMYLQQAIQDHADAATGQQRQLSDMKLALTAAEDRVEGLEATLKGVTTRAARDKADFDALSTQKQKLLETLNQLIAKILQGNELRDWPWRSRRTRQIKIVRDWGIVDPDWYLQHHQDVANAGVEPFQHYVDHGFKEGRPPNADFT